MPSAYRSIAYILIKLYTNSPAVASIADRNGC